MSKISAEEKMTAVRRRLENGESFGAIAKSMGVGETTVRTWCRLHQSIGPDACVRTRNNKYTLEFKTTAAEYYLQGKGPLYILIDCISCAAVTQRMDRIKAKLLWK